MGNQKLGLGWILDYLNYQKYMVEQDKLSFERKQLGQNSSVKAISEKADISDISCKSLSAALPTLKVP